MTKRVEGFGPKDARILICGEAPREHDVEEGRPFVGESGRLLNECLVMAGIRREECYITNVVKVRPPGNKIPRLGELGHTVEEFYPELFKEIAAIQPNVIFALGNTPLKALTGKDGITKYRGSVLESPHGKVLATVHPSYCIQNYSQRYLLVHDLKRGKTNAAFPEVRQRHREFLINPTFNQVMEELERMSSSPYLSVDFETYMRSGLIKCLGIGDSNDFAMTIPFLKAHRPTWSNKEEKVIWTVIVQLMLNPKIKKIAQNAKFELTQFFPYTGDTIRFWMDTMRAHALVYPEFPHGLDFLTSIYTDMPYYKNEGKVSSETADFDMLQRYCCKDVVATFETALKLSAELESAQMSNFYHFFDNPLMHTLWKIQMRGVKIDIRKLEKFKEEIGELNYKGAKLVSASGKLEVLNKELEGLVGHPLNVKSNKQMIDFFRKLSLPIRMKTRKRKDGSTYRSPTADEDVIDEYFKKYPSVKSLQKCKEIRQLRTLKETFLEMKLSPDGRIRTDYGIAETGRLTSKANLFNEGANLQNIPNRRGAWIRAIFIPDDGKLLVVGDLKQAEAKAVAWLARDENYKNIFKNGGDVHREYAALLFNIPLEEVTIGQRKMAKNLRHGRNYGMGPILLSKELGCTKKEAEYLIREDNKIFPNIEGLFWQETREQLRANRTLITPFGRKRKFLDRWGDGLFKEAYAHVPQSLVADYINSGLLRLEYMLPEGADLLVQVHDEIIIQCFSHQKEEVLRLMKKAVEVPILVGGEEMTIPLELKVGKNWYELEEVA